MTDKFSHIPMLLWGLCGWKENGRIITTAEQAGTTAIRKTFYDLGYTFRYIYDIIGLPSNTKKVATFCKAAEAAKKLRHARGGMAGYRDMNLYGTQVDGPSLKREIGPELETFEMLEIQQRYDALDEAAKRDIVNNRILKWNFLKPANDDAMMKAAGYYLAVKAIAEERGYKAISLKDVDGMKKLCVLLVGWRNKRKKQIPKVCKISGKLYQLVNNCHAVNK